MTHKRLPWFAAMFAFLVVIGLYPSSAFAYHRTVISSDGPNAGKEAYAIFQDYLGGSPVDGPGQTNISEGYDEVIGNHFVFHIEEHEAYDPCCTDRQRLELKGYNSSPPETKAFPGQTFTYNWYFKVNKDEFDMPQGGSFNHIFQLKMVGGDDGAPVLTFTLADDRLLFRHSPIGATMNEVEVLQAADWDDIVDKWVFASITVENVNERDSNGKFVPGQIEMTLRNLDGSEIMGWSGARATWREGGEFNRPKWGIYRAVYPDIGPGTLRFANFEIINHDWPVKKSFDLSPAGNNHIEAEDYSAKSGFYFSEKCTECSKGAYMHLPGGWGTGENGYLNYQLKQPSAATDTYIHLYGQGAEDSSNSIAASLTLDGSSDILLSLPTGDWGWATAPLPLVEGTNELYLKLLDAGTRLDKFVISASETPPPVAVVPKLDSLHLDGQPLEGFSSDVYYYPIKLPFGSTAVPAVSGQSTSGEVTIVQTEDLMGTATIKVSNPLEPSLDVTYSIQFTGFPYPDNLPVPFEFHEIVGVQATGSHSSGPAQGAIDRDIRTKWTVGGTDQSITFDLGEVVTGINHVLIAFHNPNRFRFELEVSEDGEQWTKVLGETLSAGGMVGIPQIFTFVDSDARYVRYLAKANTINNWTDMTEFFVGVGPTDEDAELPEQPVLPPQLDTLKVNGIPLAGFNSKVLSYAYDWPFGHAEVPVATAESGHPFVIEQALDLFGTARITVTHKEQESLTSVYTVDYRGLQARDNVVLPSAFVPYDIVNASFSAQHASHPALNAFDGSRATRWAASVSGGPQWIQFDLGESKPVSHVLTSHLNGHNRTMQFTLQLSEDGVNWVEVFDGSSTSYPNLPETSFNEGEDLELFSFAPVIARYVKYTGSGGTLDAGGTENWNNLIEIVIGGETAAAGSTVKANGHFDITDGSSAFGSKANKVHIQSNWETSSSGKHEGHLRIHATPQGIRLDLDSSDIDWSIVTAVQAAIQGTAYDPSGNSYTVRLVKDVSSGARLSIWIWQQDELIAEARNQPIQGSMQIRKP